MGHRGKLNQKKTTGKIDGQFHRREILNESRDYELNSSSVGMRSNADYVSRQSPVSEDVRNPYVLTALALRGYR